MLWNHLCDCSCVVSVSRLWSWGKAASAPLFLSSDPRVVFSKSVQVLLKNAKDRDRRGGGGKQDPPASRAPPHCPAALPAALLPQTAPLPSPSVDQQSRGPVPVVASEIVAAPVPAPDRSTGRVADQLTREVKSSHWFFTDWTWLFTAANRCFMNFN